MSESGCNAIHPRAHFATLDMEEDVKPDHLMTLPMIHPNKTLEEQDLSEEYNTLSQDPRFMRRYKNIILENFSTFDSAYPGTLMPWLAGSDAAIVLTTYSIPQLLALEDGCSVYIEDSAFDCLAIVEPPGGHYELSDETVSLIEHLHEPHERRAVNMDSFKSNATCITLDIDTKARLTAAYEAFSDILDNECIAFHSEQPILKAQLMSRMGQQQEGDTKQAMLDALDRVIAASNGQAPWCDKIRALREKLNIQYASANFREYLKDLMDLRINIVNTPHNIIAKQEYQDAFQAISKGYSEGDYDRAEAGRRQLDVLSEDERVAVKNCNSSDQALLDLPMLMLAHQMSLVSNPTPQPGM